VELNQGEGQAALTNSTTVTVSKNSATGNITGSWEVAEFSSSGGFFSTERMVGNMQTFSGGMSS
jgi:hypothetical protein